MIDASPPPAESPPRIVPSWRRIARAAFVRLRFLAVLLAAIAIVSGWDALGGYWEKLAHALAGRDTGQKPVSADTEYFCPMDPGVLSDWPSKCPICNMTLVRRSRGDATPLPEGVIARMQFSPYRLQLAGIRTAVIGYRPLAREVEGPGRVGGGEATKHIDMDIFASDRADVSAGARAEVAADAGETLAGRVESVGEPREDGLATVRLAVDDPAGRLRLGDSVRARTFAPMDEREPFRSQPSDPPPPKPGEPRRLFVCAAHPDVVREKSGTCPQDGKPLERVDLDANQRVRYWCPMHPAVTADEPGKKCEPCGGMTLLPRVVAFRPRGEVLAIPESALIHTGKRTVAYVERMPGMFDGVEVVVGPRCGDAYPVVRGVAAGDRVVTSGAFLVDAETRLNPSLASAYFGAARRDAEPAAAKAPAVEPDDGLSAADRAIVKRQKVCPVTDKPLGSMGTPLRIDLDGRAVFICCEGCETKLRKNAAKYLAKLPPADAP